MLRKRLELIKRRAQQMRENRTARHAAVIEGDVAPITLAEAAPTGRECAVGEDAFYLLRLEADAIAEDIGPVTERFLEISSRETWPLISLVRDPGPAMAKRISNAQVCFLDIETTGLSPNTYVFLCGLMFLENGRFVVEQLFARDYSEEEPLLRHLLEVLKKYPMVVTYNGAGFDVPFLQTRMAVARIGGIRLFEHVDLIDAARDAFSDVTPNCKLETIERYLRGVSRTGDIPGREIPDAYHDFVRSGDARRIRDILYHNRMDLLAMAYMVNHFASRM